MSYGERYGTGTLLENLREIAGYVAEDYEDGRHAEALEWAKSLMQGAMELWQRLVEEGAE